MIGVDAHHRCGDVVVIVTVVHRDPVVADDTEHGIPILLIAGEGSGSFGHLG